MKPFDKEAGKSMGHSNTNKLNCIKLNILVPVTAQLAVVSADLIKPPLQTREVDVCQRPLAIARRY